MPLNNLGIATIGGTTTITGSLLVSGSSTTARFINTSATSNSNVQLGNDTGVNSAGVALFGSQYTPSNQYRANGGYFYSNLAGGLTLHAEGANSMYLATNNTAAITIDSSQNVNFSGQIRQNGTGIIQMVPIGPTATNIAYTATINAQYTIGSTSIPATARWLLADIFITANISDHQNFMMTRFNFGSQKNWVDTRGNNPASEFGNLTQGDVAIVTYNGESDGYSPNYGVWKSSVTVPSVGRTVWINNYGNSNSNGYLYFIVRAYSL